MFSAVIGAFSLVLTILKYVVFIGWMYTATIGLQVRANRTPSCIFYIFCCKLILITAGNIYEDQCTKYTSYNMLKCIWTLWCKLVTCLTRFSCVNTPFEYVSIWISQFQRIFLWFSIQNCNLFCDRNNPLHYKNDGP